MVERARPEDVAIDEPICPVCLVPIKATDKVHGIRDDVMHEGCDYTRPATPPPPKKPPLPSI